MPRPLIFLIGLTVFSVCGAEPNVFPRVPPTMAADVENTFETQDGFQMQLIAAEPLVTDPVAMVYDENGLGYVAYSIDPKNGENIGGIITSETATSITLKRAGGLVETVLRHNVETIWSSGISLMPKGLESGISPEQMADLLSFLLGA